MELNSFTGTGICLERNLTVSYTLVRSETLPQKESLKPLGWIPTTWDNIHLLNIYGFR